MACAGSERGTRGSERGMRGSVVHVTNVTHCWKHSLKKFEFEQLRELCAQICRCIYDRSVCVHLWHLHTLVLYLNGRERKREC